MIGSHVRDISLLHLPFQSANTSLVGRIGYRHQLGNIRNRANQRLRHPDIAVVILCDPRQPLRHSDLRRMRTGADRRATGCWPLRLWPAFAVHGHLAMGKTNYVDHTVTDQTSSLRFIEINWDLGFIDRATLPQGQPLGSFSCDQLAGSIFPMFDFDDRPNPSPLILDPYTGTAYKH
jgi:hypothetical protein